MKVIAVTSGKGGAGKSCVAAYTGAAMADNGAKVLLLEMGGRSADLILGAQDRIVYDVQDVLCGRCEPEEAAQPSPLSPGLSLLAGGLYAGEGEALSQVLAKLLGSRYLDKVGYDYLIIDDAMLSQIPHQLIDTVLMVTTPESLSIRACAWKVRELMQMGYRSLRLVINDVPAQILPMLGAEDFDDVIDLIGIQLIGVIPASPTLRYSANNAQPLSDESLVPRVFDNLGARLRGEERQLLIR